MAKKPKGYTSDFNPDGFDYNKDGDVNSLDDFQAQKDYNNDKKVTKAEEDRFTREEQMVRTTVTTDAQGNVTSQETVTGSGTAKPKEKLSAESLGLSARFLAKYPQVKDVLDRAIEGNWTEDLFTRVVERDTDFGKNLRDSQEAYVIQMMGDKREDLLFKIKSLADKIMNRAVNSGISMTKEKATTFAKAYIRNGLQEEDLYGFMARNVQIGEDTTSGTVSRAKSQIIDLAAEYGITLSPSEIEKQVKRAIASGEDIPTWVEGRRDVYRQQAKLAFPSIADQLDNNTVSDLAGSYLEDAAKILGVDSKTMSVTDSLWTEAFNGPDGKPMTRQEWISKVKTDGRYGYDKTPQYKNEVTNIMSSFTAAMGLR